MGNTAKGQLQHSAAHFKSKNSLCAARLKTVWGKTVEWKSCIPKFIYPACDKTHWCADNPVPGMEDKHRFQVKMIISHLKTTDLSYFSSMKWTEQWANGKEVLEFKAAQTKPIRKSRNCGSMTFVCVCGRRGGSLVSVQSYRNVYSELSGGNACPPLFVLDQAQFRPGSWEMCVCVNPDA